LAGVGWRFFTGQNPKSVPAAFYAARITSYRIPPLPDAILPGRLIQNSGEQDYAAAFPDV
jgi:hypothetical protein